MPITVAIVTARRTEDFSYPGWVDLFKQVTRRGEDVPPRTKQVFAGEWGALVASCLIPWQTGWPHHIVHQLIALGQQTRVPDHVIVVDRLCGTGTNQAMRKMTWPFDLDWVQPMLSPRELELLPESSLLSLTDTRSNAVPFGCADKNTAIACCTEGHKLIMLDDGCLPGFGFVEAVDKTVDRKHVCLFSHRKVYLPCEGNPSAEWADSGGPDNPRQVLGVWGMDLEVALALNGYNTELDGQRHDMDLEFKHRLDRYVKMRELEYAFHPAARLYEVEHTTPWSDLVEKPWRTALPPTGWRAPGVDLTVLRADLKAQGWYDDPDETEDSDEDDEEDED